MPDPEPAVAEALLTAAADAVEAAIEGAIELAEAVADAAGSALTAAVEAAEALVEAVVEAITPAPVDPAPVDIVQTVSAPAPAPAPAETARLAEAAQADEPVTTAAVSVAAALDSAAPTSAAQPGVAKVFTVSTLSELRAALTEARTLAGAEIRVNPGNYGELLWNSKSYPLGRVYVVAATSTKPVFSKIEANSSTNMSFHGLKVTGGGGRLVQLNGSRNMSFTGGEISGFTEDGNPWDETATGLQIRFSTNVVVQDVTFRDLRKAIYTQRSSKVDLRYNRIVYVREGMNLISTDTLQVRGNHFSHFYPRYDLKEHPDAIQLWTNGETVGSTRVRIVENLISMGADRAVQGLLAGCEAAGVRHADWELTRNVYFGSSPHGLSFNCVDGLKIWNNVIVASPHADINKSLRPADGKSSGGFIPQLLIRTSTDVRAWNNILMSSGPTRDSVSQVTASDNWDVWDAVKRVGLAWEDVFAQGRPTSEAPPPSAFITKDPSVVRTRNGGVLAAFVHGPRALTRNAALTEARSLLAD